MLPAAIPSPTVGVWRNSNGNPIWVTAQNVHSAASQATAASLKAGAMIASTKRSAAARAATNASSTGRLAATTPPKADTGSEASAAGKAAPMLWATATPQGDRCLTMTTAGALNDDAAPQAASRSSRLL